MHRHQPALDLKLLIEAISPKQLVIIAASTENALFGNQVCTDPTDNHSEIGGHCLSAFQHWREFGTINGEPLHVRVKTVGDKNKADTSPQMANSAAAKSRSPKARPPTASSQNPAPY